MIVVRHVWFEVLLIAVCYRDWDQGICVEASGLAYLV